jgi:peptidoglycan-associated lipoprotein
MKKKDLFVWMILVLACVSLVFMTSCAQQQKVKAEEVTAPAKGDTGTEKGTSDKGTAAAADEAEKKRQEELERQRQLQIQIDAFESVSIYFDFDRSELKAEAQLALKNKAAWLSKNAGYYVRIEGHCDERGTNEYNLALGERRAKAAKDFLVSLGVSGDRIRTISYGEERPADPGHNEVSWARNRRDDFKLFK